MKTALQSARKCKWTMAGSSFLTLILIYTILTLTLINVGINRVNRWKKVNLIPRLVQTMVIKAIKFNSPALGGISAILGSFEMYLRNRRHQQGAVTRGCWSVSSCHPSYLIPGSLTHTLCQIYKPVLYRQSMI